MLQSTLRSYAAKGRPLFITFEGGEGLGKSTQIRLLRHALEEAGIEVVMTREPGGCENALAIRKMLVEGDADRWDGLSEVLMYSAARNEHLRTVIRPELARGRWIICDRFVDSTTVYQGEGRGIRESFLEQVNNEVVGNTWPDLTFVLDMPADEGLARALARQENMFETRFEKLADGFHERVRQGFLKIAKKYPDRCRVISAEGSIETVEQRIHDALVTFLKKQQAA